MPLYSIHAVSPVEELHADGYLWGKWKHFVGPPPCQVFFLLIPLPNSSLEWLAPAMLYERHRRRTVLQFTECHLVNDNHIRECAMFTKKSPHIVGQLNRSTVNASRVLASYLQPLVLKGKKAVTVLPAAK